MCTSNYTFSSKITTQNNIKMVRHDTIKFKWMTSFIRKINSYLINTVTNDTQNWGGTIITKCINISIKQIIKILNSKNQLVILNCLYEFFKKFFFITVNIFKVNVIVYQTKVPTIHTPDSFIIQKKNNYHGRIGCNTVNSGAHIPTLSSHVKTII